MATSTHPPGIGYGLVNAAVSQNAAYDFVHERTIPKTLVETPFSGDITSIEFSSHTHYDSNAQVIDVSAFDARPIRF